MAVVVKKGSNKISIIKWLITMGIPILILMTQVNDAYTSQMRMFLALSAWMMLAVSLEVFNTIFIPAFLLPILYYLTGTVSIQVAYSPWTTDIVYMIILYMSHNIGKMWCNLSSAHSNDPMGGGDWL